MSISDHPRRRRGIRAVGSVATAGLVLGGALVAIGAGSTGSPATALPGTPAQPSAAGKPKLANVALSFTPIASRFNQPTDVEASRDGTGRLFVAERSGVVRVVGKKGRVGKRPYLDIRGRVKSAGGEQGLLGIAFRPGFKQNRELYVAYTRPDDSLRVSRFTAATFDRGRILASTERVVIDVPHPGETNHNGGALVFGPAAKLFISTGDGGSAGDPGNDAQRKDSLLGKILRIDVFNTCGEKNYCVPGSNPFVGQAGARPEIWAMGLRNPWRFSRDHVTGDLWIGDVGQGRFEEIDRLPTSAKGANFGWSCREGRVAYDASRCVDGVDHRAPVFTYEQSEGRSVIGGHVYRGEKYRKLIGGRYLFTDFFSRTLWLHGPKSGATRAVGALPDGAMPTALGETGKREIVAVTYDGKLWRLRASRR